MVSRPGATGVTIPVAETAAKLLPECQVPPVAASAKVMVRPVQRVSAPVMVPAAGEGITVTYMVVVSAVNLSCTVTVKLSVPV